MTDLLLVRHATTASTGRRLGGRTPAELDDAGQTQAKQLAQRLAEVPLKAVYASPLERTLQTAEVIASEHGLEVRPLDGLLEMEFGAWTDRPLKALARTRLWPVIQRRPSAVRFPGGEGFREAQLRAVDAVEEIAARHRRGPVAAVSHADVIKMIVAFYVGMPLDLFQRLSVGPASVSVLRLAEGAAPVLARFNDDGPLMREHFAPPRAAPRKRGRRRG